MIIKADQNLRWPLMSESTLAAHLLFSIKETLCRMVISGQNVNREYPDRRSIVWSGFGFTAVSFTESSWFVRVAHRSSQTVCLSKEIKYRTPYVSRNAQTIRVSMLPSIARKIFDS